MNSKKNEKNEIVKNGDEFKECNLYKFGMMSNETLKIIDFNNLIINGEIINLDFDTHLEFEIMFIKDIHHYIHLLEEKLFNLYSLCNSEEFSNNKYMILLNEVELIKKEIEVLYYLYRIDCLLLNYTEFSVEDRKNSFIDFSERFNKISFYNRKINECNIFITELNNFKHMEGF